MNRKLTAFQILMTLLVVGIAGVALLAWANSHNDNGEVAALRFLSDLESKHR